MKIILSPAKKMNYDDSTVGCLGLPVFLPEAEQILGWMQNQSGEELQKLWACSDKIAKDNLRRLSHMSLTGNLTPAILSFDGIAYQYMAPAVFEEGMLDYIQDHLRILSAFYGVLRPMDGVTPYRLEMQHKAKVGETSNLYQFWGDKLYRAVRDSDGVIVNLASKEYSRCIEKYLTLEDTFITCTFAQEEKGRLMQKGVYCKMARGEMVRFMAERRIEDPEEMKEFRGLDYRFREEISTAGEYVFVREKTEK